MRNAYVRALFIAIFGLRGIWVPSDNGRVVQIVAIEGGRAYLDIDGQADDSDSLLSTTVAERTRLANTYGAGATLWRVPIPHFTPWDCNWPYGPPEDAIGPDVDASPSVDDPTGCSDEAHGSIIECEAQGLRETIPVGGTPFTLSYSMRVPGRTDLRTIRIPVTGPQVLPSLRRVEVKVTRTFQIEARLGSWDARAAGLGAWTLNVHHFYGYKGRMLYMGDGKRRRKSARSRSWRHGKGIVECGSARS